MNEKGGTVVQTVFHLLFSEQQIEQHNLKLSRLKNVCVGKGREMDVWEEGGWISFRSYKNIGGNLPKNK